MRTLAGVVVAAMMWQGNAPRPVPANFEFRRAVTVSAECEGAGVRGDGWSDV